ncbi:MAG: flagellar hook protein FlgE [Nitrospiraceae bacterium]|jgi:flagellar hook protein FlgE|nr:flagellar hook protein FlgE [Nitrospiraceae bacterium]
MGILSSMYVANSGLSAMGTDMSVIGNNISNMNTVGFKSGRAVFANIYGQTLAGKSNAVGPSQPGSGVYVESIEPLFTQGSVQSTSNALDLAIQGNGFFSFRDANGAILYGRNGALSLDRNGRIVDQGGHILQGYSADAAGRIQPKVGDLGVPQSTIPPKASQNVYSRINLDANMTEKLKAGKTFSKSSNIFDSLGIEHLLTYKFHPTNTVGQWAVEATLDGAKLTKGGGSVTYTSSAGGKATTINGMVAMVNFDGNGNVANVNYGGSPTKLDASGVQSVDYTMALDDKASTPVTLALFIPKPGQKVPENTKDGITRQVLDLTQYAEPSTTIEETQDGYKAGDLSNIAIDRAGRIVGSFSNGTEHNLGAIAVSTFNNPNGLVSIGANLYQESIGSGIANIGRANQGGRGQVLANSLEQSNVDLGRQMIDMISAERGYQANASVISADNQLMNTLLTRIG